MPHVREFLCEQRRHPDMAMLFIMHVLICSIVNHALGMPADVEMTYRHLAMRNARHVDRAQSHSDVGTRQKRAANQSCEMTTIGERLLSCPFATAAITNSTVDQLSSICGNVECNIKCFTEAVGDCYQTDQNFYLDPSVIKMVNRAMCANTELTTGMLTHCASQLFDDQCLSVMSAALTSAILDYYVPQDYANYKISYCSALSTYVSCLSVQPSGSCTSEMAQFANDIMFASAQYEGCGGQTSAFFTTYEGDIECSASHADGIN
ncbi:uncharacterized protein LOC128213867 isoform X2 [Mya arenaria]|uniref:uncharacterized protein LOC128213590 isoform X1 n=1 Tax=Mya arenaria TaxID=6604 RepID=UPI0022E65888|nr:uncharacterized protein LOC128213590 isoform X1 [Mya arenaria]XP_052775897.1 uncharacterized protein LOC128213867 isoform X2 [Mya arenaria]